MKKIIIIMPWLFGFYYFATGWWAILDIESFMAVTGHKQDLWLVKTVGMLVVVTGFVILISAWRKKIPLEIAMLAAGNAAGFITIDVYYAFTKVISPIYLLDAVVQAFFLILWLSEIRKILSPV